MYLFIDDACIPSCACAICHLIPQVPASLSIILLEHEQKNGKSFAYSPTNHVKKKQQKKNSKKKQTTRTNNNKHHE